MPNTEGDFNEQILAKNVYSKFGPNCRTAHVYEVVQYLGVESNG